MEEEKSKSIEFSEDIDASRVIDNILGTSSEE